MHGISHRFRNKIHVHANLLYFVLKILYSVNMLFPMNRLRRMWKITRSDSVLVENNLR